MAALLSSLIACGWVGLRALWRFWLEELSVDELVGAWCFGRLSGLPGFTCLISFALVVQFYLLLGHCLCFVSFLCLGLHVLGDGALVDLGSFMRAGHMCVLVCVWAGVGVGAPLNQFGPSGGIFSDHYGAVLLLWSFCVCSVLCLLCICMCLFICALWSPAGKGLTSWLSFVVSSCEFVTFPLVSLVRCGA